MPHMFNPSQLKKQFPIFAHYLQKHKHPLVYLDNGATSQKPQAVIAAISNYYQTANANVGRGIYQLAEESTQIYHNSRQVIAKYFGAQTEELILTRNTTESLNAVAYGWGDNNLEPGDVILTSPLSHHSNLVVWQQLAQRTNATLKYIELTDRGRLDLADLEHKLAVEPVRLLAVTHVSNVTGAFLNLQKLVQISAQSKAKPRILLDGAQSAVVIPPDFSQLDIDFYAFSGHKMLGPMGMGGLLVKRQILADNEMQPWLFGGGMIDTVKLATTSFNQDLVERFTAGTPNVAGAVGLAAACEFLTQLGHSQIAEHDQKLVQAAIEKLRGRDDIDLIGPVAVGSDGRIPRIGSVAFTHRTAASHDVAQVLAQHHVAVRAGHHCCTPLHHQFEWEGTVRASFQVYNSTEDIEQLAAGLDQVEQTLAS